MCWFDYTAGLLLIIAIWGWFCRYFYGFVTHIEEKERQNLLRAAFPSISVMIIHSEALSIHSSREKSFPLLNHELFAGGKELHLKSKNLSPTVAG